MVVVDGSVPELQEISIRKMIQEALPSELEPGCDNAISLARALYAEGRLEDFIPDSLIEPVAEVLKWAKQIQDARKEEEELDSVMLEELPPTETAESMGGNEMTGESV